MHVRMWTAVITGIAIICSLTACEPTSPEPVRRSRAKKQTTAAKAGKPTGARPGGHRAQPLRFAIRPGKAGEVQQRPQGVWKAFGRDMRIFQDPAPGEGSAPPKGGTLLFSDDFNRAQLGDNWRNRGKGHYGISNGTLFSDMGHNENVFLVKPLPKDARIELDVMSETKRIDIKISLYDDGREHESGYVVLAGGWYNRSDLIVRGREHDHEAVVRQRVSFEPTGRWVAGKTYHWTIIRQGSKLSWYVNNKKYLEYDDPEPLWGPANRYLSISNWESRVHIDNLEIYDLTKN